MSLATLARKTKTQQRLRSTKCGLLGGGRSVGFVLNMTGRGGGIGLSGMSYKQTSGGCNSGQAETCCAGDSRVSKKCREDCGKCWYGGLSQPAPQMSYRTYINRKANAAYRPGGSVCCDNKSNCDDPISSKCLKPKVTWKQSPDIAASTITEHRAQATIRCANSIIKRNPVRLGGRLISNRLDAKPVCSWYNPKTCKYETINKGPNPLTQNNQCTTTLPIRGRLGYTRINKNWCNTTKTLTVSTSSSEQIAKRKQKAFLCPCGPDIVETGDKCKDKLIKEENRRDNARYCYPRPFHTGKMCGLSLNIDPLRKAACKLGCPKHWNSGNLRLR